MKNLTKSDSQHFQPFAMEEQNPGSHTFSRGMRTGFISAQ